MRLYLLYKMYKTICHYKNFIYMHVDCYLNKNRNESISAKKRFLLKVYKIVCTLKSCLDHYLKQNKQSLIESSKLKKIINFFIKKFYDGEVTLKKLDEEKKRIMFDMNYKYYAHMHRLKLIFFLENLLQEIQFLDYVMKGY